MNCGKCGAPIDQGDEREYLGEMICEDCYMDCLSPTRTCDPWAVYSATNFEKHQGGSPNLTATQSAILEILEETKIIERQELLKKFGGKLSMAELEREFATLRHMEKVRGEKKDGKIFVKLW